MAAKPTPGRLGASQAHDRQFRLPDILLTGRALRSACAAILLGLAACRPGSIFTINVTPRLAKKCGVERWAVKTLTDTDAARVNLKPQPSTIATLTHLKAPRRPPATRRVKPTEFQAFTVEATLTGWKLEADHDFHLVLSDSAGHTMIAEIPDTMCVGGSRVRSQIGSARVAIVDELGAPSSTGFQTVRLPVTVTGVGFFDFQHGQRGVAPNAIELHPVLDITFTPASARSPYDP